MPPEKVRGMFDGLRLPANGRQEPERVAPERKKAADPEEVLRRARTKALVRHARVVNAIFEAQERGGRASPEQVTELQDARKAFEEVRPYGSHDAEAAYKKNPELAQEAATGQVNRAIRTLQLETELRTDPQRRADRAGRRTSAAIRSDAPAAAHCAEPAAASSAESAAAQCRTDFSSLRSTAPVPALHRFQPAAPHRSRFQHRTGSGPQRRTGSSPPAPL